MLPIERVARSASVATLGLMQMPPGMLSIRRDA